MSNQIQIQIHNTRLADELAVINAIYGDGTTTATKSIENHHTSVELRFPDDAFAFLIRFPNAYPDELPTVTGVDALHLEVGLKTSRDIGNLQACLIANHDQTPGEEYLYQTICDFEALRLLSQNLSPDEAEVLADLENPAVVALRERLGELATAVQESKTPRTSRHSKTQVTDCSVCLEPVFTNYAAKFPSCQDHYCIPCLQRGITSMLNNESEFRCCGHLLHPKLAQRYGNLASDQFAELTARITYITDSKPLFCHSASCSAYIPVYRVGASHEARCLSCELITCAECRKAAHPGRICAHQFEVLDKLAKQMKWQKCPKCGIVVERTMGCKSIMCVCKTLFCYNCGKETPAHLGHATVCCLGGALFDNVRPGIPRR
jgi:hypothetical protein